MKVTSAITKEKWISAKDDITIMIFKWTIYMHLTSNKLELHLNKNHIHVLYASM